MRLPSVLYTRGPCFRQFQLADRLQRVKSRISARRVIAVMETAWGESCALPCAEMGRKSRPNLSSLTMPQVMAVIMHGYRMMYHALLKQNESCYACGEPTQEARRMVWDSFRLLEPGS